MSSDRDGDVVMVSDDEQDEGQAEEQTPRRSRRVTSSSARRVSYNVKNLWKEHEREARMRQMRDVAAARARRKAWKTAEAERVKQRQISFRKVKSERRKKVRAKRKARTMGVRGKSRKRVRKSKKKRTRRKKKGKEDSEQPKRKYRKTKSKQRGVAARRRQLKSTQVWVPTEEELDVIAKFDPSAPVVLKPVAAVAAVGDDDKDDVVMQDGEEEGETSRPQPQAQAQAQQQDGDVPVDPMFYDVTRGPVHCSLQAIRAVEENNAELLRKVFRDVDHVHNPFIPRSSDCPETCLELAIRANNIEMIKLMDELVAEEVERVKSEKEKYEAALRRARGRRSAKVPKPKIRIRPHSKIHKTDTGSYSFRTLGHATRRIQGSRGGREGNDAFIDDAAQYAYEWQMSMKWDYHILRAIQAQACSNEIIDYVLASHSDVRSFLFTRCWYAAVEVGMSDLAAHLSEAGKEYGGFGFNDLHPLACKLKADESMPKYRVVSVTKKSNVDSHQLTPAHCAAVNPYTSKYLIEFCGQVSIHVMDKKRRKPIHFAAACVKPDNLKFLVERGADLNERDVENMTPLHFAARAGRAENIEILMAKEEDRKEIDARSKKRFSPLLMAVKFGHLECVRKLVDLGANANFAGVGPMRQTPVMVAAKYGHLDILKYLLEEPKAKTSLRRMGKTKMNPLMFAVKNHHFECARYLMTKGSSPLHRDSSENYVAHYASGFGNLDFLRFLKACKITFDVCNMWKTIPLVLAVLKGFTSCSDFILQHTEDLNSKDQLGRTILHQLLEVKDKSVWKFISYLLNKPGVALDTQTAEGVSLFHLVASNPNAELDLQIANSLAAKGAPMDLLDDTELSPLDHAISAHNFPMIKFLFMNNVDVTRIRKKAKTNVFHRLFAIADSTNIEDLTEVFKIIFAKYDPLLIQSLCLTNDKGGDFPLLQLMSAYVYKKPSGSASARQPQDEDEMDYMSDSDSEEDSY